MNTIKEFWSGDEWMQVEMINNSTGILKESSINKEYGYHDMVLLDLLNKEITQVIKKETNTIYLGYDISICGHITDFWKKISQYFKKENYYIQKHADGVFFLSIPIKFDDDELMTLIENCPIKCYEITQDDTMGDDYDEDDDLLHFN